MFTSLLCFYALRSALLALLGRWLAAEQVSGINEGLAALDLLLQMGVALELVYRTRSASHGGKAWQLNVGALLLAAAVSLALGLALPARGHASLDRFSVFLALLFPLLWSAAKLHRRVEALHPCDAGSIYASLVLQGFAAYGLCSLLALLIRYRATWLRNGEWYLGSLYVLDLAYLAVLIFWLVGAIRLRVSPLGKLAATV